MFISTLAVTVGLLCTDVVLARPIKGIERAVIQDEYDFIIAGGNLTSFKCSGPHTDPIYRRNCRSRGGQQID